MRKLILNLIGTLVIVSLITFLLIPAIAPVAIKPVIDLFRGSGVDPSPYVSLVSFFLTTCCLIIISIPPVMAGRVAISVILLFALASSLAITAGTFIATLIEPHSTYLAAYSFLIIYAGGWLGAYLSLAKMIDNLRWDYKLKKWWLAVILAAEYFLIFLLLIVARDYFPQ